MGKLYNEFFYIPKYGKIREKVMLASIARTITIVVICLAAISFTAYAYFSYNITSGSNMIKAAKFDAKITVMDGNSEPVNSSNTEGKKTVFTFAAPGAYTVKIEKGTSTAGTGFCIVDIGNDKYHTQQVGIDIHAGNSKREFVAFILRINEPNTVVTIESHWGTSSYYHYSMDEENIFYIVNGEPLREIVIGDSGSGASVPDDEENENTESTTPAGILHTVAYGETLGDIAAKYGVTAEQIAADNGIANINNIQAGQTLKIIGAAYRPSDTEESTPSTEATQPIESTTATEPSEPVSETAPQTTEPGAPEEPTTEATTEPQPTTETEETTEATTAQPEE